MPASRSEGPASKPKAKPEAQREPEPEPQGYPIATQDGIVFVAEPEKQPDLYILVKSPEERIIESAGARYYQGTGRWVHSYRLRKAGEGGLEFVYGPPSRLPERREYARLGTWGEGHHLTWRSTDRHEPSRRPSWIEEHGRFVIGNRNRGVPGADPSL